MSYNILVPTSVHLSGFVPLLKAARLLRERGHSVRLIINKPVRGRLGESCFQTVLWSGAAASVVSVAANASSLREWLEQAIFNPLDAYASDIGDEIRRRPTDIVLSNDTLFGATLAAEAAGVPIALLSPEIQFLPRPVKGSNNLCSKPAMTSDEETAFTAIANRWSELLNGFLPALNGARTKLGLNGLCDVMALFDRADRILIPDAPDHRIPTRVLADNVRFVGPLRNDAGGSAENATPVRCLAHEIELTIAAHGHHDFRASPS